MNRTNEVPETKEPTNINCPGNLTGGTIHSPGSFSVVPGTAFRLAGSNSLASDDR